MKITDVKPYIVWEGIRNLFVLKIEADGPGLGVEFNEEAAKEQTFKFWEAPHWHRRDGSHQNW